MKECVRSSGYIRSTILTNFKTKWYRSSARGIYVVLQSDDCDVPKRLDFHWLSPDEMLMVSELMDLRSVCGAFQNAGLLMRSK